MAVLSLMLPIRLNTFAVLLRPFEVLIVFGIYGLPMVAARRGIRFLPGFLLLLPYLLWHVVSAASGGLQNARREALQVAVVAGFGLLLAQASGRPEIEKMAKRLLWGTAAIAAGTISWHLVNGYTVGWKRLPDPRLAFITLPVVLAGVMLFAEGRRRAAVRFGWTALFPVLMLSGERKALVIYLVLTALLFGRGRLALIAPAVAAGFVVLFLLSTVISHPYLQKQINTIVNPGKTGNYGYLLSTGRYAPGDTPSNVQRAFAFHVSQQLFTQHPLVGVGTNQYVNVLNRTYPNLPPEIRLGIHGEFQRILTENGLLGLVLYLGVWGASWLRLSRFLRDAAREKLINSTQRRVLPLLVMVPLALFLGTEAPGTRAFVIVVIISLLPELVRGALAQAGSTRCGSAEARSPSQALLSRMAPQ